jgi:hypothetical protein
MAIGWPFCPGRPIRLRSLRGPFARRWRARRPPRRRGNAVWLDAVGMDGLGKRQSPDRRSPACIQAATASRVWSVSSNCTGWPVVRCRTTARGLTRPPTAGEGCRRAAHAARSGGWPWRLRSRQPSCPAVGESQMRRLVFSFAGVRYATQIDEVGRNSPLGGVFRRMPCQLTVVVRGLKCWKRRLPATTEHSSEYYGLRATGYGLAAGNPGFRFASSRLRLATACYGLLRLAARRSGNPRCVV